MILSGPDSPGRLRKYNGIPTNVFSGSRSVAKMHLYYKIQVFINNRVITEAPDSPRRLRKHRDSSTFVRFPINNCLTVNVLQNRLFIC